jgi:hypothetical protein
MRAIPSPIRAEITLIGLSEFVGPSLITVLDRPKLEQRVCECYAVVKKEMDRLLPDMMAS